MNPTQVTDTSTPLLELRGVNRSYGENDTTVNALIDATVAVQPGEFVAIMGPSGSGKSTLLTIAGGLENPTSGQVLISGQDTTLFTPKQRAQVRRKHIGYVFQNFNLLPALTATENVSLALELEGVGRKSARSSARKALEKFGLGDRSDAFPDELSGGQQQRVAIARATVGDRKLILADEPTGALDSVNAEQIMRFIRLGCEQGVGVMMVTHDSGLAAWADRIIFLRDGRILDSTAPDSPTTPLTTAQMG